MYSVCAGMNRYELLQITCQKMRTFSRRKEGKKSKIQVLSLFILGINGLPVLDCITIFVVVKLKLNIFPQFDHLSIIERYMYDQIN